DGRITQVRFFKGSTANGGTHTGSVWSSAGVLLATVSFANETPSGWQSAKLAEPLAVTAGTTYVVSYFAPQGHYASTSNFFADPWTSGDLRAPAANNGRFLYASGGGFPQYSFNATNYFADVAFQPGTTAATISVTNRTPAADAANVSRTAPVSVTFSAPVTTGYAMTLSAGGSNVAGSVALSPDARTLTFTPAATLAASTVHTVDLSGVVSTAGAPLGAQSWSFTTEAPPALTIADRVPVPDATNASRTAPVSVTFSGPVTTGYAMTLSAGGSNVAGSVALSPDARTLTFTPAVTLAASTVHTVNLSGVVSTEGAPLGPQSWSFTTQAPPALTITSRTPVAGATNVSRSNPVTVSFSAPIGSGYAMALNVGATAVAGSVALSTDAKTLTFTPSGLMPASSTITVTLTGVVSSDGAVLSPQTWSFTTEPRPTLTQSLFTGETPAAVSTNTRAIEVGTHFTTSVAGSLTAIRFYKNSLDTGTHTVAVWRPNGTRLARVTVTGESASGWQVMTLPTAIALTAGQTVIVSYTSPTGRVSQTTNYFTSTPYVAGPLTATRSQNARFTFTSAGAFPSSVATGTNYFVDPVFRYLGP
ncbi:MAG: DUF4082 domain-containing protein, partial [Nocardioides sp.]